MDLLHHLFRSKGTGAGDKEGGTPAAGDEARRAVPHWRLERDETKLTRYTPFAPIGEAPPGDLVLLLEDVLPGVPTSALKAGLHSPEQRLCFSADELFTGLAKGRATIALSVLADRYPEIFEKPARAEDDVQVPLPLQKLIQQVAQIEGLSAGKKEAPPVEEAHLVEEAAPVIEPAVQAPSEPAAMPAGEMKEPVAEMPAPVKAAAEESAEVAPKEKVQPAEVPPPPPRVKMGLTPRTEPTAASPALVSFAPQPAAEVAPAQPVAAPSSITEWTPPKAVALEKPVVTVVPAPAAAEPVTSAPVAPEPPAPEAVSPPAPPVAASASQPHLDPPSLLRPTVSVNELSRVSPLAVETPSAAKPEPVKVEPSKPEPIKPPPVFAEAPPKEPASRPPLSIPVPFAKPPEPTAPAPTFRGPPTPPLIRAPALNIPAGVQARVAEPAPPATPPAAIPIPRPSFAPPVEPEPAKPDPPAPAAHAPEPVAAEVPPTQPEPSAPVEPVAKAETTEVPPPASEPELEPEPILQEGQIAATTIQEDDVPPVDRFSLERIDQEPLQAIFMTDEQLDLPRISELSAKLPGISGCLILAGETMTQGGERPSGLDAVTLRELSRQLATTVDSFKNKLPAEPMFTLYGGNRALSIFARGLVSLCVVHATRGFLPGVRERLNAVADTLAHGAEADENADE